MSDENSDSYSVRAYLHEGGRAVSAYIIVIIIIISIRAQAFSWLSVLSLVSSPNGTKITVQSPALYTLCTIRKPRRVFRLPTSNIQPPTSNFRLPTSNFQVGSWKWEVGSWKSEVGSQKSEDPPRLS
ncbi:unnamed protein product [Porites evermanni]|uniref:Uncharacterized protein n=1 Tax=Porites evermanni TaxID=104178 RepID=A0ABN8SPF6_9CNID|nr:unnamed protein product [Porites evermanni]